MRRDTVQDPMASGFRHRRAREEKLRTQHAPAHHEPCRTTLLELVTSLHQLGLDERQVVEVARELVDSGQAVLTGNFRGCRFTRVHDGRKEVGRAC